MREFSDFFTKFDCTSHTKCDILLAQVLCLCCAHSSWLQRITITEKLSKHTHSVTSHHTASNMKLHLPKQLFTALLTAITLAATPAALTLGSTAWGKNVFISDEYTTEGSVEFSDGTGNQYLIYDKTDNKISSAADFIFKDGNVVWSGAGSGDGNNASTDQSTIHTIVELTGKISTEENATATLKLNHYTANVIYRLTNAESNFDGEIWLDRGAGNNGITQLSLAGVSDAFDGALIVIREGGQRALSIEGDATLGGLKSEGSGTYRVTSNSASNILTLNVTKGKDYTFGGNLGGGTYYSSTDITDTTAKNSTSLTLVKSGAGSQTISGTSNLNNLTVSAGTLTLSGQSSIAGTAEIKSGSTLSLGAASHTIGTLSGSGALSINSSTSNASATISKLGGYTGTITVDKASTGTAGLTASVQDGALNLAGITVKNGATATIRTRVNNNENLGQDINLGNVAVGGNSTLTVHFSGNEMRTATLTTLDVNGTAAVVASNYHGQISINSLTSSGDTNALTLTGNTPSDAGRTVFNLKDGAFDGSIYFKADASGTRKFALNIEDSSVVQDAVINTSKTNGGDHHMAIGIGADSVTVKGLTGGVVNSGIYSGSQEFNNNNFSADSSKFRTLIIDTDGSKGLAAGTPEPEYSTSSSLSSNLNLQKDGVGSQTFTGNLSAFNGTVTVNQGTLALESTAAMNSIQSITVNGGELTFTSLGDVSGLITMNGGSFTTDRWNISGTQEFSTSGEISMSIEVVNIANNHKLESSGAQNYFTHSYGSNVEAEDGNGYQVQSGDFILFKGLKWDSGKWETLNVGGYGEVNVKGDNTVITISKAGTGQFFINYTTSYDSVDILGEHGVYIGQGKTLGLDIATEEQTLSTNVEGSGALEKTGAGTLKLTGSNTYSGGTTIAAGTLSVESVNSLGTGGVTVGAGAELEYTGSTEGTITALTLNNGAKVNATSSAGTLKAETAAATGAFTKNGDGTLVLNSVTQLGGTVTVNKGILQIGGGDQKLNSAQVNGGTLRLTGTDIINWGDSVNIQVLGGTLDLDARQSVDSTTAITLKNGIIEGDGGSNRGYTVGLELHNTSTLTITSTGTSSITTNIGMRKEQNDNGGTVKFAVNDGTLTVSGKIEKNQPTDASISGKVTKSGAGELILSGDNTYANGTTIEAGTVTTKHTNALGSGGVNMTGGELKITDVANTDTDLTLKGMLEMNASASAKLATAGTTLNLGTTGSVKKVNSDSTQHVTIASNGTNAASMTAKSENAQLIQMQQDASFTIADMTLTNTTITAATTDNTKVSLNNVSVAAGSAATLAEGAFAMQNQAIVGMGGGECDFTTSSYSGFTLGTADSKASITLNLGDLSQVTAMGPGVYESITILLEGFHMTDGNASIFFAADSWLGQLLSSQGATVYVSGSVETQASVSSGSGAPSVSYSAATGDNVGTIITITGLNVPEPATSTLSLLALAALCARRRRKM